MRAAQVIACRRLSYAKRSAMSLKGSIMLTSARNQFWGKVTALHEGAVNDEVDITLPGGARIVAIITRSSTQALGLKVGADAVALIKAPWVILAAPDGGLKLSTRNRLEGTVEAIRCGAVNTEVDVKLAGGESLVAIITETSVEALGLTVGQPVVAYFKASHVIVGVKS